jgi:murein L,D-transpeptidase YafK
MKRLAQIFSALVLLCLLAAGAALILLRPSPAPVAQVALAHVDRIVVEKSKRRIQLFQNGTLAREYRVALGPAPIGDKLRQGDGRTPEGIFQINRKNAGSAYHLSLGLDYPRADDIARAAAAGVNPGGDIMIHGQPNMLPQDAVIRQDWTAGCIAVSNAEMDEIFAATQIGTEVEIRP